MTTHQEQKEEQRKQWGAVAATWERWGERMDIQTQPLTAWFSTAIEAGPGKRILDLACGAGQPALTLAREARPAGEVIATDLSPEMLAVARRRAAAAGITNVEFHEMDAEDIKFPDASFDAVTMRFGLMFCPDPVQAASEIRRVLKRGCPFAIAVWDEPQKNPRFTTLSDTLNQITPPLAVDPKAPGIFRLAPPGELESVLKDAGFSSLNIESRPLSAEYDSPEQYWEMQSEVAAPLKAAITNLPPADVARLKEAVIKAVQPFVKDGLVHLPGTVLCASGVK